MPTIRILDPIVASRIAAGEVVERPSSVLRELLDNSIDAQSSKISVHLQQGGIESLTVADNGSGISAEDLPLAFERHSTSKISTLDDLFSLRTLGFRGEALNSISSCSKLTISSNGYKCTVDNGVKEPIVPGGVLKGTTVTMENLFEKIPARKLFLKRPSSEALSCKSVFLEKALGAENVEFLFFEEGNLKLHLSPGSKKHRVLEVMSLDKEFSKFPENASQAKELDITGDIVSLKAICSSPSCYKSDRSQVKVFVNNRIVDNFVLVQAVCKAYSMVLPGGRFPYFYLFITDEPSMTDFNIHPAKRQCNIRNQGQVYSLITQMIHESFAPKKVVVQKELLREEPISLGGSKPGLHYTQKDSFTQTFDPSWFEKARQVLGEKKSSVSEAKVEAEDFTYIGQAFGTFLLIQKENQIWFIDQHAAHERLLYDEIRSQKDVQRLMIPYKFEVDRSVDEFLLQNSFIYGDFGIELTQVEPLLWEMSTMPATCRKEEAALVKFISSATGDTAEIEKGLFAVMACHSAIKAGDYVDAISAKELIRKVLKLEAMVCPHGRSFVWKLSREELYRFVGRTE